MNFHMPQHGTQDVSVLLNMTDSQKPYMCLSQSLSPIKGNYYPYLNSIYDFAHFCPF
jgi:hypothetical protein